MTQPLISIICAAYNAERFIEQTLAYADNQTYHNIEIIVVDDCSTDKTTEIVQEWASFNPRIQLIKQSVNSGAAASRNLGIKASKGEYIAVVDADDLCEPTKIGKMVKKFQTSPSDIGLVYTWSSHIDEEGRVLPSSNNSEVEGFVLEHLVRGSFIGNGSCVMFKRSALDKVGLYDVSLKNSEDTDLYIRIAEKYRFAVVAEYLTAYRKFTTSKSSNTEEVVRAKAQILRGVRERYPELPNSIYRESDAILYQYLAGKTKENNQHGLTAKWLFLAMCVDPSLLTKRHLVEELIRSSIKKLLGGLV